MIELAKKYTAYGAGEFQGKQYLKKSVIFSVDILTRDGCELPPSWKAIIVFRFVIMDHFRQVYP